jgi:hypothetical protein
MSAPRATQWLVRLQHDGEFRQIEAPDIDQRTGALLGRDLDRVRERIADLAQGHKRERRRQCEIRCQRIARTISGFQGHVSGRNEPPRLLFAWFDYKYSPKRSKTIWRSIRATF